MKQFFGIIIYRDDEKFVVKKSKLFIVISRVLLCLVIATFVVSTSYCIQKYKSFNKSLELKELKDYYEFLPSYNSKQEFASKYYNYTGGSKAGFDQAFADFLGYYQENYKAEILSLKPYDIVKNERLTVKTYAVSDEFQSSFYDLSYLIKKGRWFEGNEIAAVIINSDSYRIGDSFYIHDSTGKGYDVKIIGSLKHGYYADTSQLSIEYGVENLLSQAEATNSDVFLLNPNCAINTSTVQMPNQVLVKNNNPLLIHELSTKGKMTLIKNKNKDMASKFVFGLVLSIVSLAFYLIILYIVFICEWEKKGILFLLAGMVLGFLLAAKYLGIRFRFAYLIPIVLVVFSVYIMYSLLFKRIRCEERKEEFVTKFHDDNESSS